MTYRIKTYRADQPYLHVKLEVEHDCILHCQASTTYNPNRPRSRQLTRNSKPCNDGTSWVLERQEALMLSYEPGKRQAYIEMLHQ